MNIYQRVAKNFSLRYSSIIICKILNFGFILFLTNHLGDYISGEYFSIVSATNMIALIVDAGLATILQRECSKDHDKSPKILFNMIVIKLFMSIIMIIFMYSLIVLSNKHFDIPTIKSNIGAIYFYGFFWIFNSFMELLCGVFIAFEKLEYDAVVNLTNRGVAVILSIFLIWCGGSILSISFANFLAAIFSVIIAFRLIQKKLFKFKFQIDIKLGYYLLMQSLPLAFALLFSSIYFHIDTIMLLKMRSPEEVGWYGSVYRILEITMIIPSSFSIVLFPIFSRLYNESREKLSEVYTKAVRLMFITSLPIALFIMHLSDPIALLFGKEFIYGSDILSILIWAVCLIFVNFILLTLLTTIGLQKINAYCNAGCIVFNVILNLVLIPLWGGVGAAIATTLTEFLVFSVCYRYVKTSLGALNIANCFLKPVISLLCCHLTYIFIFQRSRLIGIVLGLIVYFVSLVSTGAIKKEDLWTFKRLIDPLK
jgi:O-antigen/teichoic acid export membrane protein